MLAIPNLTPEPKKVIELIEVSIMFKTAHSDTNMDITTILFTFLLFTLSPSIKSFNKNTNFL